MANNPPSRVLLWSPQVQLVNLSGFWEVAEPSRNWYTKFWLFWISAARLGMKNYAEVINCNINRKITIQSITKIARKGILTIASPIDLQLCSIVIYAEYLNLDLYTQNKNFQVH